MKPKASRYHEKQFKNTAQIEEIHAISRADEDRNRAGSALEI